MTQIQTPDGILVEEYRYDERGVQNYEMGLSRGVERNPETDAEGGLLPTDDPIHNYDADGYLTDKTGGTGTTEYGYSLRGELPGVTLPDGTEIGYFHDPQGRRTAKSVSGVISEKYLWLVTAQNY